eukprot:7288965-Alexandrium_andersonii.AAC.1
MGGAPASDPSSDHQGSDLGADLLRPNPSSFSVPVQKSHWGLYWQKGAQRFALAAARRYDGRRPGARLPVPALLPRSPQ